MLGLVLGWMTIFPMIWIAWSTRREPDHHWSEFWAYYELKYQVSRVLILPFYLFLSALGIVSTVMITTR
jgi:hypothetical protein